jgi:hypothetical protein
MYMKAMPRISLNSVLISTSKNSLSFLLLLIFNKIRDKGKTVSAWKLGDRGEREVAGGRREK